MPSLHSILLDTMPLAASTNSAGSAGRRVAFDPIHKLVPASDTTVNGRPGRGVARPPGWSHTWTTLWSWDHDKDDPCTFRNLKCRSRACDCAKTDPSHEHTVCSAIQFGSFASHGMGNSITAVRRSDGRTLNLSFDPSFMVARYFVDDGPSLSGRHPFWKLPSNLDSSMVVAFAYDFDDSGTCSRVPAGQLDDPDFMPRPRGEVAPVCAIESTGPNSARAKCVFPPTRVVVALCLTCCKERRDFEPGGVLAAARFFPHIMVMASVPLTQIDGAIILARPPSPDCAMADMGNARKPLLITDTNQKLSLNQKLPSFAPEALRAPLPLWDNLFDYYDVSPSDGVDFHVVKSRAGSRSKAGLVARYLGGEEIEKVPRQGEFDNIHIAPRMVARADAQADYPKHMLDRVVMAPFCMHDCMHTHVRWSTLATTKQVLGWDTSFHPHSTLGAPMVPHNQDVWLRLGTLGSASFAYKCRVSAPIDSGTWQIMMHHGSAYALDIDGTTSDVVRVTIAALGKPISLAPPAVKSFAKLGIGSGNGYSATSAWWSFYASLRFAPGDSGAERLFVKDLAGCRDL